MSLQSHIVWTLVYGLIWNALGWAGNVFLLGGAWDAAGEGLAPDFTPPWSPLTHELLTFVSDFVFAFAFVWIFARLRAQTVPAALALSVVLWLAGVVMTYLAMVNSGFLPWPITVQTSLLALTTFLVAAPLLPLAMARAKKRT
jgi:hypothetical protein